MSLFKIIMSLLKNNRIIIYINAINSYLIIICISNNTIYNSVNQYLFFNYLNLI